MEAVAHLGMELLAASNTALGALAASLPWRQLKFGRRILLICIAPCIISCRTCTGTQFVLQIDAIP